jgi:nanoRNase/pAp phosphatase (c-di-AMP/oligoRNAs hydrolase)
MRLITRSDFDGLACGIILESLGLINEWVFVHPKDTQDGLVKATDNDVLANIPYVKGCKLWFDHHSSESERLGSKAYFEGVSRKAPSCARVVYEYYGGDAKLGRFAEMIHFVDKVDSGTLIADEITNPQGWVLLGYIMDPRTGVNRFSSNFSIGNNDLMVKLAHECLKKDIDEILSMPEVKERVAIYREHAGLFHEMLTKNTKTEGNAIVTDLRGAETIYVGNRFLLYTMFPDQNISVWIVDGPNKANTVITVGYSIINRTATADIGSLMLHHGGGGHFQVGTCQVPHEEANKIIAEIIKKIK